jgi:hypothetical protein
MYITPNCFTTTITYFHDPNALKNLLLQKHFTESYEKEIGYCKYNLKVQAVVSGKKTEFSSQPLMKIHLTISLIHLYNFFLL